MNILTEIQQEQKMGHNAKVEHQRVIARLLSQMMLFLEKKQIPNCEVLPETDIDPGNAKSQCPDIQVRNEVEAVIPVIIEIATKIGTKADLKKIIELINSDYFGIEEGFVYNYETNLWYKYCRKQGIVSENTSFSDFLETDLQLFLK